MPENDPLHDLLSPLRSPAVGGPPPGEIRRRGERRQRRNRALLATGVAAAVAAVAIPLTLGSDGPRPRNEVPVASDPSTGPSTTSDPTTMLDYVDVGVGMRGDVVRGASFDPGPDTCSAGVLPGAAQDVATARVDQSEGARRRAVLSYESTGGATAVFDALRTALSGCADTTLVAGSTASLAYVTGPRTNDTGEATVVRAVLIDSYVLVDSADILGAGSDQVVDRTVALLRDQATQVESELRLQGDQPNPTDLAPPAGVGPVGLGIGRDALEALPGMDYTGPDQGGCQPFAVPDGDQTVAGVVSDDEVEVVELGDRTTPEGIGVGSPAAEIRAAYTQGTISMLKDVGLVVGIQDAPDRSYLFEIADGTVTRVAIVLDPATSDCLT